MIEALQWLAGLFEHTEQLVELRACPNVRGSGRVHSVFTRDPDYVTAFVERWSGQPYGVYFGAGTRSRHRGTAEDVAEIPALWVDIDDRKPLDALLACWAPPTFVLDSGHGLHGWWLLDEGATAPWDDLLAVLRGLCRVFAGDPAVCDVARIMRLPGTLNTKNGDNLPVKVIHSCDRRYSLSDLTDWLSWQGELVGEPVNPFAAAAEKLGMARAVSLEDMAPGRIHDTQLRWTASMVTSGQPEDKIVAAALEATRLAAGEAGRKWDWRKEEAGLRQMIRTAQTKFAPVVDLDTERKKREPPAKKAKKDHAIVRAGRMALEAWGRPLITVKGELWTYHDDIWHQFDDPWEHDLKVHIQGAVEAMDMSPSGSTLSGAYRWLLERPELVRREIAWDSHRMVVGNNGTLVIDTGAIIPSSPDHYVTRRVACAIDPSTVCPVWDAFLAECLPEGAAECLQEWFGAALVRGKTRELTKGLIVYGPSRTGKTQITEVVRALLGGATCGVRVRDLGEKFGREPLITASGWVADDAVGMREEMDAEGYKTIVTGESTSVQRKNRGNLEVCFDLPVLLTMNNYPVVKDDSDAVYNRTLVLPMERQWSEEEAKPIGRQVVAEELAGVLNWAIAGWHRLRDRGWFAPPEVMIAANKEFKSQNNSMNEFIELCVDGSPNTYVMRNDFTRIFNAWMQVEYQSEWKGKRIGLALIKSTAVKVYGDDTNKGRIWVGIRFKEAALAFEDSKFGSPEPSLEKLNHGLTPALHKKYGQGPKRATKF